MKTITLTGKNPNEIMDIIREMRSAGWIQGTDFDFAYHQSRWDDMIGEVPKYAIFTFYTEKYATFFALKWA